MKPVPRWFEAICWVLAVLFSLCVGLQFNDPDPIRWSVLYGSAALAAATLPARRSLVGGAIAVGLVAAAWGAFLTAQVAGRIALSDLWLKMSEKGGAVEVGREAGGLVIVAVTLIAGAVFRATRA